MSDRRLGWIGLSLSLVSVLLVAGTALLGRSAAVPVWTGGKNPPYAFETEPSAALVTALLVSAAVVGCLGVLLSWLALRRGWRPPVRALLFASVVAALGFTVLPHVGSADPESYAAYGRMAAIGLDPYRDPPSALGGGNSDTYGEAVESPWRETTSVYGPLATLEARAVAEIVGDHGRIAMWLLCVLGAFAFIATTLLLHRLAPDPTTKARVAVFWAANPLVLWQLVAGAHIDTLMILGAVAGLALLRRSALLAGVLGGAAVAVKAPAALVGGGLAWALRRDTRRLPLLGAGALVVLVATYATASPHVFDQGREASRYTSRSTPWRSLRDLLETSGPSDAIRTLVFALAVVVAVALAVLLWRALPSMTPADADDHVPEAVRTSLVLVLAWVLAAPYALPWYDGLAWALMVLVASSRFDLVLLAHTTVLSLAYIPGRDVPLPGGVQAVTDALRDVASPTTLGLLVVVVVILGGRKGRTAVG